MLPSVHLFFRNLFGSLSHRPTRLAVYAANAIAIYITTSLPPKCTVELMLKGSPPKKGGKDWAPILTCSNLFTFFFKMNNGLAFRARFFKKYMYFTLK